ncbi:2-keto-4-pentenoate hydratase [Aeromicrobium sp. Leaf350]|uniref:2-keto-4-pentenoate hydratase n=1 Tax=Aeromicrobium sp. Leaf350 TaxID=2876565 RepID=UPI001E312597|nr:fumarylacetoacetate hydrolase family protein [Aeromicrobium sp. Leaf350]
MTLTAYQIEAADRLDQARTGIKPTAPVRDVLGSTDVDSAYVVQAELTRRRVEAGGVVVGRKIGLTSPAVQKQLGVDQPDFGVLFADMHVADGGTVPTATLLQPKVEAEVAFLLGADLDGPLDLASVRAAVTHAVPALEIVDSRVDDWDITIVDTVADNGSSAAFVLGETAVPIAEVEPREVQMQLTVDGDVASSGDGAACLGDPLEALLWLARAAQDLGDPLREGQIILSGALGPMVPVTPGSTVRAVITGLGDVSVAFDQEVRS